MDNQQLLQLLEKQAAGKLEPGDAAQLEQWYQQLMAGNTPFLHDNAGNDPQQLAEDMLLHFRNYTLQKQALVRSISGTRSMIFRAAVAAAVLIILTVSVYYWLTRQGKQPFARQEQNNKAGNILPGGNKATLTLSNGNIIDLAAAANGVLYDGESSSVKKDHEGLLVYNAGSNTAAAPMVYNSIRTPKGGQYQVVLSDGTHVWLNAASSLRYPATFSGHERRVELAGEAYFEVAHDNSKPFFVDVASTPGVGRKETVQVLGTHFNINAYADEPAITTTLLEGKIKISAAGNMANNFKILSPGQQAVLTDAAITLAGDVNTRETIAWKNGFFAYTNAGLQTIMRQAARWYDVEVEYESTRDFEHFRGSIERTATLSEFLKILELNNVRFEITGRKIIVK